MSRYLLVYTSGREKPYYAKSLNALFKKLKEGRKQDREKINRIFTSTEDLATWKRARNFYKSIGKSNL